MPVVPNVDLDTVFNPHSAAIVGASPDKPTSFAARIVTTLKETGFPAIYPVNPGYNEVFGLPCYPTVSSIPGTVEHVIVCIPAAGVLSLLDDCARKGVKSVHFFTAGFSESGQESGIELEKLMLEKARSGGFRIIGPNCTGLFIPKLGFATATRVPMEPGNVSFLSQSGGHSQDMPLHAGPRGIRFSKVISYGNAIDIDECELLEYFASDTETEVISAYIEGVRESSRFFNVLKNAAAKKPVVICKGGTSRAGLRAAAGHTASLTSSVEVFRTLCRQANAILVNNMQEMIDVLVALTFALPSPSGRNIAILGVGGGPSVEASDCMEPAGLQMAAFSQRVQSELGTFLPRAGTIFSNPLDALSLIFPDMIYRSLRVLGCDKGIDIILYHIGFHPVTWWGDWWGEGQYSADDSVQQLAEALEKGHRDTFKPVIAVLGPVADMVGMEEFLRLQKSLVKMKLPVFHSLDKAAIAMARLVQWHSRFSKS